jgi:hypothetical protein
MDVAWRHARCLSDPDTPLFHSVDRNLDGVVNAADAKLQAEAWVRAMRSAALNELLYNDLDFDGVITRDEVVRTQDATIRRHPHLVARGYALSEAELQRHIGQAVERIMRADRNNDGRIDWDEMLAFAREKPVPEDTHEGARIKAILSFDADGDGSVTLTEFDAGATQFFAAVDANHDGVISREEIEAANKRRREEQQRQRAEVRRLACAMPKPSDAARVILLRAPSGDALSTVTLLSQDVTVDTRALRVETGDDPLYLIVRFSDATIFRLSGAVGRIERLVLAGSRTGPNRSEREHKPLAGVTGIAADRVTFLGQPDCIEDFLVPSEGAMQVLAKLEAELGRRPVPTAAFGKGSTVAVPSGQISGEDREPFELTIRSDNGVLRFERGANRVGSDSQNPQVLLRRFYEGGIVDIDPAAVIASVPVERYTVLPSQAGLLQLLQAGVLQDISKNSRPPKQYLVRAKTRFPAGLHGGHLVKFIVARGVPKPDGDPGHSCVVMEETGQSVGNSIACGD